jgi:HAE1 family hydrophobic/amphiphilic exporter-1
MMLLVLVGGCLRARAQAQTNASSQVRTLSLQDCIQMALRHNLDLQIDRYNPQIALFTLKAAYGAYDPVFSLSGQHDHTESGPVLFGTNFIGGSLSDDDRFSTSLKGTSPVGTTYSLAGNVIDTEQQSGFSPTLSSAQGAASFTASQPLLKNFWIDSTRLNIKVSKNRVKYSEQGLKQAIMNTVTAVEQAYYDLIYDRQNVMVQEKAVELATQLVVENKKRVEVGALAPLDEQQAEAQAASTEATLIAAKSALAVQEHLVKQIITDQYAEWVNTRLEPSGTLAAPRQFFDLQDSWSKGLALRPDLLQAKLDVEQQGIQLKFSYNQLFPELDVFGTYGYNGSGGVYSGAFYDIQQMNRPAYTFGGLITIPLGNTTARNNYKSGKVTLQQLVLTLKKLEQTIMVAIDNDIKLAESNFKQVAATRTAREYAGAALDAEQKKLESGKSTTYTVLQMQRDLTTARGNEIQALDNYNKALVQLSLDEGTTLQRLNINVEVK